MPLKKSNTYTSSSGQDAAYTERPNRLGHNVSSVDERSPSPGVRHHPKWLRTTGAKIPGDFSSQTNKQSQANQQDTVVVEREQRRAAVRDVAIPADGNIGRKERERVEKHQGLKEHLEQMWLNVVNKPTETRHNIKPDVVSTL